MSQNGFGTTSLDTASKVVYNDLWLTISTDNSGQLIKAPQTPGWTQGDSVNQTLAVIQLIANKYAQLSYQDVVVAIELLNEPLASSLTGGTNAVTQFYNDGYGDVRKISNTPVMLHDAFQNVSFWDGVLAPPGKSGGEWPFHVCSESLS